MKVFKCDSCEAYYDESQDTTLKTKVAGEMFFLDMTIKQVTDDDWEYKTIDLCDDCTRKIICSVFNLQEMD